MTDLEPSIRNKRTSRVFKSRSCKGERVSPVRLGFGGRVLRNKKPSRIPGKIISERVEMVAALLVPEANPDLWYELQGDSDEISIWGGVHVRPYEDLSWSREDLEDDLLDLMWAEQMRIIKFYDSDSSEEYVLRPDDESSSEEKEDNESCCSYDSDDYRIGGCKSGYYETILGTYLPR